MKTATEATETVCTCGHAASEHDHDGCYHQERRATGWSLCDCTKFEQEV